MINSLNFLFSSLFSDGVLRKKWKYLRDQFAVEVGKLPYPRSGDSGERIESKWPYFKPLTFLLGIVKPRATSSNLRSNSSSKHEDENVELVAHRETGPTEGAQEIENQVPDIQLASQQIQQDDSTRTNSPLSETLQRKRKRTPVNSQYNQKIITLEEKRLRFWSAS